MRIVEVVIDAETALRLEAWARAGGAAVLLGREFGGAVIVTGAVPPPPDEEGWARLASLRHGPVGLMGSPPPEGDVSRLLPGDILVDASAGSLHTDWVARCLDWTGPADEHRLREVPLSVARA